MTLNFNSIPTELKGSPNWVLWKLENKRDKTAKVDIDPEAGKPKLTKVPYQINGKRADSTNPDTWNKFEYIERAFIRGNGTFSGIGFVFSEDMGIVGIDWDHVRNPETGEFDKEVLEEITSLGSYAELSQSGTGAHVLVKGKIPGNKRRKDNIEMYSKNRFFVVTGKHIEGNPREIIENQKAIKNLYEKRLGGRQQEDKKRPRTKGTMKGQRSPKLTDDEVLNLCRKAQNKEKFIKLFDNGDISNYYSTSEANQALCNIIAFYTQDKEQIYRIFSKSKIYGEEWIRKSKYDIQTAIESLKEVYMPKKGNEEEEKKILLPFNVIGDRIISKVSIFVMEDTKEFYIYRNGVYRNRLDLFLRRKIREEYSAYFLEQWVIIYPENVPEIIPVPKVGYINEVLEYIADYRHKSREFIDSKQKGYINFKNGVLRLNTWAFEKHNSEHAELYPIRQIPIYYDPAADCLMIKKFISEIIHPSDVPLLQEWIGYCLIPDITMQKALMLVGTGANGKSVLLNLLTKFWGEKNISGESLQKLETDKFSVANLYGKLVNVYRDLSNTPLEKNDTFNTLTGNDHMIRGEKKYRDSFDFENTARLMFSANDLPQAKSNNFAYYRRWLIIEFPNQFTGSKDDKTLFEKISTKKELSGLLNWALEGLKRLLEKKCFSHCRSIEETEKLYKINCDPVAAFLEECTTYGEGETDGTILNAAYNQWAEKNGKKKLSNIDFPRKLKALGLESYREWKPNEQGNRKSWTVWSGVTLNSFSSAQDPAQDPAQDDDKKSTDFIEPQDTENSTFCTGSQDDFSFVSPKMEIKENIGVQREAEKQIKCESREKENSFSNRSCMGSDFSVLDARNKEVKDPVRDPVQSCSKAQKGQLNISEDNDRGKISDFKHLRSDLIAFAKSKYRLIVENVPAFVGEFNKKYPGYEHRLGLEIITNNAERLKERGWK